MYSFNYEQIVDEHLSLKMKLPLFLNVGIANIPKEYHRAMGKELQLAKTLSPAGSVLMI